LTDNNRVFQLARLYTGAQSLFEQVSRTPGIGVDQLAECRRLANLLPPLPAQRTDDMPGALGLFRGDSIDFILVKAQQAANGAPLFQYLLMPAAPLRLLAGHVLTFESFAREPIPQYATPRTDLAPFVLENPESADSETQIEDLLALLTDCKNRSGVINGLLSALVQMMGIGVINAPLSMHDRLTFVQGLLTLLPAPVRSGITFATSVIDPSQTNTQIKFLASDSRPARHLIFDWEAGKLLTDPPNDTYSNFIMSQFRLDPSLVIQQTRQLEKTAAWRQFHKDELATALAWASKRASLDSALRSGLPADSKMVADVLRDDPTLPEDLRIIYARHLVTIALSLDEPERADSLLTVFPKYRGLAEAVYDQLVPLAEDKTRSAAAYHLAARWINSSPDNGGRWRPLLTTATLTRANTLAEGDDLEARRVFLESFFDVSPALQLDSVIAQVIGISRKWAYKDARTACDVFLLAVTFLPVGGLQRLLADQTLVAQLPEPVRMVFVHLTPNAPRPAPHSLLARAAGAFAAERKPIVLARLAEWALLMQRTDLIDADVLRGMVEVGSKPLGVRFDVLSQQIVEELSRLTILRTLDMPSVQALVALSLVRDRYDAAIAQLEFYQNTLYRGGKPELITRMVRALFQETPLTAQQFNEAFDALQNSQLRVMLRAQAYLGALVSRNWSPDMTGAMQRLTAILSSDASLIPQIGFEATLRLIKTYADQRDTLNALKLASALVENALLLGDKGIALTDHTYTLLNWGPEMASSALEVLRNYVRRAPLEQAKVLAARVGKRQGEATMKALDATYQLRLLLGGADFVSIADQALIAVQLLTDMSATYHESQETPPIHKMRRTLEGMPGGLSDAERERLAANCYRIADQVLQLSKRAAHKPEIIRQLVQNAIAPLSSVDALRWIGSHFAYNQPIQLNLERAEPPNLLSSRSVNIFLRETDMIVSTFNNMLTAFPEGLPAVDNAAFRAEVDSVWALLPPYLQRQTLTKLAENTQLLAELIALVGDKGHERSLATNGFGRQLATGRAQPRSVIDALRWINGYFSKQHIG